jgi:16S rRNA (guanine966-N2)-methyltransferase
VRVIAGRFGGRRLSAPRGARTRPTADRVREALFSVLGDLEGARVLDLFAGSGALGIEALSRGAAEATFVDTAPAALRMLRDNLAALEIAGASRRGASRRRPQLPAQRTKGRARIRSRIPRSSIPARGRADERP